MIKLALLLIILSLPFLVTGCSEKKSIFDTPIQKDRGELQIIKSDGFIGAVAVGTTLDYELNLKSIGGLDVTITQASLETSDPLEFKGGAYPGTGGDCSIVLKSGASCKIVLIYSPTSLGSHLAKLKISYVDAIASSTYSFNVSADSHPILTFEYGSEYDFGNKFVGTSTDLKIKISNTGKVNAESISINNLSAPFSFKGGSYPGIGGSCGSSILRGQSCDIIIKYSPTSNGQHLQDITLDYFNAGRAEENTLNLIAWGFYEVQLSIASASGNDFGTVPNNNDNTKTYLVTHTGGDVAANVLTLSNLAAPFTRVGGTCGSVLTIDQGSCTIIIALNSTTSGTWSNTFSFSYFNGTSTITLNRTMTGVSKNKPILTIAPSGVVNFANTKVGSTTIVPFTLTYASGELPATAISLSGLSAPFALNGGTCGASLSSGSCTINVKLSPTTYGTWAQPITISYNNAVGTFSSTGISVAGASDGKINPNVTNLNFNTVVAGQTKEMVVRVDFTGGAPVSNIAVQSLTGPYQFSGGAYPGSTSHPNRCATTMSSGFCYVFITFAPLSEGTFNGNTLVLSYNNGVDQSTASLTLNGTGSPAANLSLENKAYPSSPMNSAIVGPSLVRMSNSSSMTASSIALALPAGFSYRGGTYPGLSGNCSSALAGNSSCNLDIVFTPLSAIAYSGTLSVSYNDGTVVRTATSILTGTGTTSSELYVSTFDQVTFSSIYVGNTSYPTKVLKIGHGGSSTPAAINSKSIITSDFTITTDTCPASLNNGQTCDITVAFTPQTAGVLTTSLQVIYDNGSGAISTSRTLKGTGVAPAVITASPSPLNYGQLPTNSSYDLEFTLTKTGSPSVSSPTGSITGSGFTFKGGTYPGTGGTCPTSGPFPGSCKVVITFTPLAIISYNGMFNFTYYNGFQSTLLTNSLSGSGFPTARLAYMASTYSFGQVIQTSKAERTIIITNTGTDEATSMSFSSVTAPYQYKGGSFPGTGGTCGSSLASTQSCNLEIEFAPTTVGVTNQILTVTYDNGYVSTQTSSTLNGEGLAQAIISISETNPYNFGTTNVGATIEKSFTLTNAGSVSGTSIAGSFNSPFGFKGTVFPGTGGTCGTTLTAGSTCSIVLSFTPQGAAIYSSNFTLNYHDGLRAQTELKELRGTGSAKLLKLKLLELIRPKKIVLNQLNPLSKKILKTSSFEVNDLNFDGFQDELETYVSEKSGPRIVLKGIDGLHQQVIYKLESHLSHNLYQGLKVIQLKRDFNHDGENDLLIGTYVKLGERLQLLGFDVICRRSGHILIRYLPKL